MKKINKHVHIVRSATRGLSSMSQESCDAIYKVLSKNFSKVSVTEVNNYADLQNLIINPPEFVFLGMEYVPASAALGMAGTNKVWLGDFLDKNNIAYTGSPYAAHKLGRNKPLAKQRVLTAGLNTSAFCVIKQNHTLRESEISLSYPIFVKPADGGGGMGIDSRSVVYNFNQLQLKVNSITSKCRKDSILEEYLPGREFSVAVLRDEQTGKYQALALELIAPADKNGVRLLSNKVKSSNAEQAVAIKDLKIKAKVNAFALDVFQALGARDYGRIDIRLDKNGEPHFLEANLIPSLISGYGSFPKACVLNLGLDYEPMIMQLVQLGMARSADSLLANEEYTIPSYPTIAPAEALYGS